MKNLFLTIIVVAFASLSKAQVSTAYKTTVESIFQVNRSYVTTGLLQDYGFFYTNVEKFNGVRSDSSYLEYSEWQAVYNSLYTYRFNTTAVSMPVGATVFDQVRNVAVQNSGSIVFAGLHYRYERFKSNAATSNLVYISNNKIYDTPGRPTTPYEIKEAFAMVPQRSVLTGASHTFLFKPELFYSNTGKTISTLKIDFNDGAGYRTISANTPVVITYSIEGEKKLIFKVTYTDASSVESHTKVDVRNIPAQQAQARYTGQNIREFVFPMAGYTTKPHLGIVGGALVTIEYANPDEILRKPLIILSGLDPWKILHPENLIEDHSFEDIIDEFQPSKNGNLSRVINLDTGETLSDALESADYDLIFVDYDNGTDYIQRNAYMLQSVIQWVNDTKMNYNGERQENVILGFSMGGLVARYALCDWEISGSYFGSHETSLNVSIDSPHQGANIPLGMQAATLNIAGSGIYVGLQGAVENQDLFSFGAITRFGRARDLANAPATRQMLMYQVVGGGGSIQSNNDAFTTFMTEYHQMGLPTLYGTRNIAIADGSECAIKQPFNEGDNFININKKYKIWLLANFLSSTWADVYDYAQTTILGLPMKTDIHFEFKIKALSNQTASEVYKMKLSIKKQILFVINIDVTIINKGFDSENTMLAIDNAPGGIKDLNEESADIDFVISRFCHSPTFSTLDISGGTQPITAADLTKIYSAADPPAFPKNVRMDNFMTNPTIGATSNQIHTQLTFQNSNWLLDEITGTSAFFSCYNSCSSDDAISGASILCDSDTYSLNVIPSGAIVSWQVTPSNLFDTSSGIGGSAVLDAVNSSVSGSATLNFTVEGLCGSVVVSKSIWVGKRKPTSFISVVIDPWLGRINAYVQPVPDATGYLWYINGVLYTGPGMNNDYVVMPIPKSCNIQGYTVGVKAMNLCGTSSMYSQYHYNPCYGGGFLFSYYPNPVSDVLIIEKTIADDSPVDESNRYKNKPIYTYKFFDFSTSNLVLEGNVSNKGEIDVSKLATGRYVMHISVDEKYTEVKHIIVDR